MVSVGNVHPSRMLSFGSAGYSLGERSCEQGRDGGSVLRLGMRLRVTMRVTMRSSVSWIELS